MSRTFWICTTLLAYAFATAFVWSYDAATAGGANPAQVDTAAITMQAKTLPTLQPDMF